MNSNQQKKVMIYSVGHTGTHFLNDLIETCTEKDKIIQTEKYILKKIGVNAREKYSIEDFIKVSISLVPIKKRDKAELMIFWSHIYEPNSTLLKSITKDKPPIPCVSPMRDPLLRLNTNMFWNNKYNINANLRLKYIKDSVKMFIELLSIPDEHRFLFPVDLQNIEKEQQRHYKDLFDFCNLKPTMKTLDFYNMWKPAHETTTHHEGTKMSKKRAIFETNKTAILNKDTNTLIKTMNPELTYLQRQEDLKKQLERYGYKDLVWW